MWKLRGIPDLLVWWYCLGFPGLLIARLLIAIGGDDGLVNKYRAIG